VVDAFSRIIRLGEGVSSSGVLSEAAMERAFEALSICRDKMANRGVTRARLIATEACRAAANGAEFLARVREEVGIELEVVDRETEALLAATGCTPLIDPQSAGVILFDIGGGSTELVRLGPPQPSRRGAVLHTSPSVYHPDIGQRLQRWGDYSGVSIDPFHPDRAWIVNEYARSQTAWGSRIGRIGF
jgi:exopolyphosphatase/pppGpp-phosphohydrolase